MADRGKPTIVKKAPDGTALDFLIESCTRWPYSFNPMPTYVSYIQLVHIGHENKFYGCIDGRDGAAQDVNARGSVVISATG